MKRFIAENNIDFYTLNAVKIAQEIGLGGRINMIMQAAFFKIANIIPVEDAVKYLKDAVVKSYGKKGEKVVNMNYAAIDKGVESIVKIEVPADWKDAVEEVKEETVVKSYGKKGEKVVNMNYAAIDKGVESIVKIEVPADWKDAVEEVKEEKNDIPAFIKNIVEPINAQKGFDLPVSAFEGMEDGTFMAGTAAYEKRGIAINVPEWQQDKCIQCNQCAYVCPHAVIRGMEDGTFMAGTAAYEKRGIAINVPEWQQDKCIQCNQCAYVCPHAVIRPFLLNENEKENAPESLKIVPAKALKTEEPTFYTIGVTPLDCTGCGNCAQVCPAPGKALIMKPMDTQEDQIEAWDYAVKEVAPKKNPMNKNTVKGSQFEQPLFEFSGACAGCGETPYAKLVTQLFGDRMMIANATGCSSIWGGSVPATPYTVNNEGHGPAWANSLLLVTQLFGDRMMIANATGCSSIWGGSVPATPYTVNNEGHGPAWANSLFEDNAEFGLGMYLGVKAIRERIADNMKKALEVETSEDVKAVLQDWLDNMNSGEGTRDRADRVLATLEKVDADYAREILKDKEFLVKRSQWIFGGDGWAYDIGYGGLDHVLASGEDVNVLVFDTEIYSNTGGQSSKSTPTAAIAKFAASGKRTKKKDLGMMAMTYGYVYVAQISMGADKNQTLKAIAEAEAYDGPSLIIAYAPCISHGIKSGMANSQDEAKKAVECGYWGLYRYNPNLIGTKNPFSLDSKEPKADFREFLMGEVRYASLAKAFPEAAEALFEKTEKDAMERLANYKRLAEQQ